MKINFSTVLKDMSGAKPLIAATDPNEPDKKETMTLAKVACDAIMAEMPDEKRSGKQKAEAYELALRIMAGRTIEISIEEAALIKDRIGKAYGALVVGQCWPLLEKSEPEDPKPLVPDASQVIKAA